MRKVPGPVDHPGSADDDLGEPLGQAQTVTVNGGDDCFGVLPFHGPLTVIPQNSFEMYEDIAVVETSIGETIHPEADAASHARIIDRLWQDAVEGDDARRLIGRATVDLTRETSEEGTT
jgi:hypothetical protein